MSGSTLERYQLRLPSFEGPLDVLLQLIERERLEISDVSLVLVIDGFMDHLATLDDRDPHMLAGFLSVAARLLLLKSRAMLPRPAFEAAEVSEDDLAQQLREYQLAKHIGGFLRGREAAGLRSFGRPTGNAQVAPNVTLVTPPVHHLRRAVLSALARGRREVEVARLTYQVSIAEMIERLRERVTRTRIPRTFESLLDTHSRDERVAGFVALLALWRRGEVDVTQTQAFGDIWIVAPATAEADQH